MHRSDGKPAPRIRGGLWLASAFVCACLLLDDRTAWAKRYSYASPEGRSIYSPDERFGEVSDFTRRNFVLEVVTGIAPQGNLGMLLGVINIPARGVEFYAGYGVEANPAWTLSADARYLYTSDGWRPFIGVGYSYRELAALDAFSHNVFAEVGYKWLLGPTYHLTLAGGLRRAVAITVRETSPLRGADTDPDLLADAIDGARVFVPTVSLKFSRAF
jgi:hypothetical protein